MAAKLKYNEDHSSFRVCIGEDQWDEDLQDGDDILVLPPIDPGDQKSYIICPEGCETEGVEPNTVYELVKVVTILEPDGDLEEGESEE